MNWSFYRLVEAIQKSNFSEIYKLRKSLILPSKILTPFIHTFTDGGRAFSLLRVGGRLLNANLPYDAKFPLLLPKQNDFMYFTSSAVHLDLMSDLSTVIFLLSFKRFAARRGLPREMYYDNAMTFVGANRFLIDSYAASSGVRFSLIPPRASHNINKDIFYIKFITNLRGKYIKI